MASLTRSRLPEGSKKVGRGKWVAPNNRSYKKTDEGYRCMGDYKPVDCRNGRLKEGQVSYIKGQLAKGGNQSYLAEKFEVSVVTIHHIAVGKIWGKVSAERGVRLEGPPKGVHRYKWSEFLPYDAE